MDKVLLGLVLGILLAGAAAALYTRRWIGRQLRHQRRLVERARRAERLAEMGTLTSHLMHEIRNPLSTIKLNLQLLAEDVERLAREARGGNPDQEAIYRRQLRKLEIITREAERLAETLNDFLRYAGKLELQTSLMDVNEILDDLIDFYEPQALNNGIRIRRDLDRGPARARVDAGLLKQAVLNLMINAVQHMNQGGELIIRTRVEGENIRIDVIDTGPGIAPELQGRVFEAYYSTRPGGSGLGLAICRRIVEAMNGHVDLHSEPGKGSDFIIELPLAKEEHVGAPPLPGGDEA